MIETGAANTQLPTANISARGVLRLQIATVLAITSIGVIYLSVAPEGEDAGRKLSALAVLVLSSPLVALIRWDQIDPRWSMSVPLFDIVVIAVMRADAPTAGFGVLLVLPVCWLASTHEKLGAIAGPTFAAILLWATSLRDFLDDSGDGFTINQAAILVSLPLALAFTSGTIYFAHRRLKAQRSMLKRQQESTDAALDLARREEQALRTILDAVDFCVVQFDADGSIVRVNRAVYSTMADLGLDPQATLSDLPLYAEDGQTPLRVEPRLLDPVKNRLPTEQMILWLGDPGGIRRAFTVKLAGLENREGDLTTILVVAWDVTGEVEAVRARDDLVASVSHELRTPLTSILGYVELAHDDQTVTPSVRKSLEVALRNTNHLMTLVDDLLTVRSRDPQAAVALELTEIELPPLIAGALEAIRPLAADHGVQLSAQLPHQATVKADPARLRQVFDNVLSNAIKYNVPDGSVDVQVRRLPDADGRSGYEVRVSDTGRGMSLSEVSRVFDRFYRAESVRGTKVHGTGLGLNITRDIVHRHGGSLEVFSEPGVGTTVLIRLRES